MPNDSAQSSVEGRGNSTEMLRYLFLFCGFVLVLASDCFGESPVELTPELAKKITIAGQLPDYPAAAWRQNMKVAEFLL
jgi:hypothetical protein